MDRTIVDFAPSPLFGYDVARCRRALLLNTPMKTTLFWGVILGSALVLWQITRRGNQTPPVPEISYSDFLSQVQNGNVSSVRLSGRRATGVDRAGKSFQVIVPTAQSDLMAALQQNKVEIWLSNDEVSSSAWLFNLAPLVLLAFIWYFMINRMRKPPQTQSGGANALNTFSSGS